MTELMPKRVVGNTERCCGKLKTGKGFLEPNFGVGPNTSLIHGVNFQFALPRVDAIKSSATLGQTLVWNNSLGSITDVGNGGKTFQVFLLDHPFGPVIGTSHLRFPKLEAIVGADSNKVRHVCDRIANRFT